MLIAYATIADPRAAIELYKQALDATVANIMEGPDGSVMHAELLISGQRFMFSGEWPGFSNAPTNRSPVNFMLYVDNADAAHKKAIDAGMTSSSEPQDMFWGDRNAKAVDGHGYEWTFAHQFEKVSADEMQKRANEFAASFSN